MKKPALFWKGAGSVRWAGGVVYDFKVTVYRASVRRDGGVKIKKVRTGQWAGTYQSR